MRACTLFMSMVMVFFAMPMHAVSTGSATPNFVFILADDLDFDYKQDRLAIMPNLRGMREAGAQFVNHVAAHPVCGPSRSSFLAGRYPHNVGYQYNGQPESIAKWVAQHNNTVATWLTTAGYYTAFHGKYVNGAEEVVPSGWRHWGAFSSGTGTYNYYNSTPFNISSGPDGVPVAPFVSTPMNGVPAAAK